MTWFSRLFRRRYARYVDPALVEFAVNNPGGKFEPTFCKFSFVLFELSTSASVNQTTTVRTLRDFNARIDSVLGNLLLAYFVDRDIENAQSAATALSHLSLRVVWGRTEGWIGDKGGDGFTSFGPMFDITPAVALLCELAPGSCAQLNPHAK